MKGFTTKEQPLPSSVKLIHGDCLGVLWKMKDKSVDAVVTDPPYGKKYCDGGISGRASDKWARPTAAKFKGRRIIGDDKPDTRVVAELYRVLRDGGALFLFSQWMTEAPWIASCQEAGFKVRNRLIWAKPFHGAGDLSAFGPQHESIVFATKGKHEIRGSRDGDVWSEGIGSNGCFRKGQVHPNQKPTRLMRWLVEKCADNGQTVLDPFMGSGTTGVACVMTGRNFIGIEIDEGYFKIAERRIKGAPRRA